MHHEAPSIIDTHLSAEQSVSSPSLSVSGSWHGFVDDSNETEPEQVSTSGSTDDNTSLTFYKPMEQSSLLLDHYFSSVCQMNSAFDSLHNPFRSEVSKMIINSPLLFYCVLSMSAAHLYQGDEPKSSIALEFQTEAISHLSIELSQLDTAMPRVLKGDDKTSGSLASQKTDHVQDDVLLGVILLGMTSAWHNSSATGVSHLFGCRQLFKAWMASNSLEDPAKRASMNQKQCFLVSSMIYWEAMSSFVLDQDTAALSYLDVFCQPNLPSLIYPCPWTGVGTPVFVFLAKTGILLRNKRVLRNLRVFRSGEAHQRALYAELLDDASALERDIIKLRIPFVGLIEDVGDPCTPPDHFLAIARCYRLATLLELYRGFPELIKSQTVVEQAAEVPTGECDDKTHLILGLAFGILGILESIPIDSGTISIQLLALMIAGSALCVAPGQCQSTIAERTPFQQTVTRWRGFVRQRILYMCVAIGLRPVNHAVLILEEVWSRMDMEIGNSSDNEGMLASKAHWLDVMSEKKLETIFG
ncbi:fungal-specific transcription factor domain-containing protein [Fusarium solani]|uniref:Fungal-specific transcription factor domain-containing protein n=2 Tax=Fusarium solani TaxID=169388 RepID=A0A9P9KTP5_FUSSL|nr:fungal-specific transcription factor domain-containing protein [Fusarium solani]KAH7268203.1 fungal-specific transcription factor domain-containing protein [Fusarium solani]